MEKFLKYVFKFHSLLGGLNGVNLYIQNSEQKSVYQLEHIKNDDNFAFFEATINLKICAIYHYYFSFEINDEFIYYKKINLTSNTSVSQEECWKLSVGFDVPDWAKGANMYHIFVDRFNKSSGKILPLMRRRTIHKNWNEPPVIGADSKGYWNIDFYGGDLNGITEKIPYLKSLNIDIIYLSPICLSQSNHRYDTADYETIDPYAGDNEDLRILCETAHNYGMKVILDSVFNHTGNDSKYFNEYGTYDTLGAFQSEDSPYYDFYKKHWFHEKREFSYWWGMKNLPECDSSSEHWRNYICGVGGVIDKWFSLGIDGLRLDVADELSDEFIEDITKCAKRNKPDSFVIGEVWKNPMRMNRGYISSGRGMHSVMNYLLVDALIRYYKYLDVSKLDNVLNEIMSEYPDETIPALMNFTSTHDISRLIEIFGANAFNENSEWAWNLSNDSLDWINSHHLSDKEYYYGKMSLKSYIIALAFLPGIFSIFYGDEIGLRGVGNLANRAPFTWNNVDDDLLMFFRRICELRHNENFLRTANFKVLEITPKYFSFERYNDNEKILVYVSRSHLEVNLDKDFSDLEIIYSLNGSSKEHLTPYGALILKA